MMGNRQWTGSPMMSALHNRIEAEAERVRSLHEAVHSTYRARKASPAAMEAWRKACDRFRRYQSPVIGQIERIQKEGLAHDRSLRDFAITFLQVDPMYFRSGYVKAELLHRLKSIQLDRDEAARLAGVLVDAIQRRGQREFLSYCRLAAVLGQPEVMAEAARLAASPDGRVASRARMMVRYLSGGRRRQSSLALDCPRPPGGPL
jgi:hypothetical protein